MAKSWEDYGTFLTTDQTQNALGQYSGSQAATAPRPTAPKPAPSENLIDVGEWEKHGTFLAGPRQPTVHSRQDSMRWMVEKNLERTAEQFAKSEDPSQVTASPFIRPEIFQMAKSALQSGEESGAMDRWEAKALGLPEEERNEFLTALQYMAPHMPPASQGFADKMATKLSRGVQGMRESLGDFMWDYGGGAVTGLIAGQEARQGIEEAADFSRQMRGLVRGHNPAESTRESVVGRFAENALLDATQMAPTFANAYIVGAGAGAAAGAASLGAKATFATKAAAGAAFWIPQTAPPLKQELVQAGVSEGTAKAAALAASVPISIVEQLQVNLGIGGEGIASGARRAATQTVTRFLLNRAADYGEEYGEEVIQEAMALGTKAIVDFYDSNAQFDWREELAQSGKELYRAMGALAVMAAPGQVAGASQDIAQMQRGAQRAARLDQMIGARRRIQGERTERLAGEELARGASQQAGQDSEAMREYYSQRLDELGRTEFERRVHEHEPGGASLYRSTEELGEIVGKKEARQKPPPPTTREAKKEAAKELFTEGNVREYVQGLAQEGRLDEARKFVEGSATYSRWQRFRDSELPSNKQQRKLAHRIVQDELARMERAQQLAGQPKATTDLPGGLKPSRSTAINPGDFITINNPDGGGVVFARVADSLAGDRFFVETDQGTVGIHRRDISKHRALYQPTIQYEGRRAELEQMPRAQLNRMAGESGVKSKGRPKQKVINDLLEAEENPGDVRLRTQVESLTDTEIRERLIELGVEVPGMRSVIPKKGAKRPQLKGQKRGQLIELLVTAEQERSDALSREIQTAFQGERQAEAVEPSEAQERQEQGRLLDPAEDQSQDYSAAVDPADTKPTTGPSAQGAPVESEAVRTIVQPQKGKGKKAERAMLSEQGEALMQQIRDMANITELDLADLAQALGVERADRRYGDDLVGQVATALGITKKPPAISFAPAPEKPSAGISDVSDTEAVQAQDVEEAPEKPSAEISDEETPGSDELPEGSVESQAAPTETDRAGDEDVEATDLATEETAEQPADQLEDTTRKGRQKKPSKPEALAEQAPTRAYQPGGEMPSMVAGMTTKIDTLDENLGVISATYAVVELADLTPSHDFTEPGRPQSNVLRGAYPEALQPRNYSTDINEQDKVARHAQAAKPELFVNNFGMAHEGPPVATLDGVIINGNGRTMALQLASTQQGLDWYKSHLVENAEQYGIDPEQIGAMQSPVLVRVVDMDARTDKALRFARAGNQVNTQMQGVLEVADNYSRVIDLDLIEAFPMGEHETFAQALRSKSGRDFLDMIARRIPATEYKRFFENGEATEEGKRFLQYLMTLTILPKAQVEHMRDNRRRLMNTLEGAIPTLLRFTQQQKMENNLVPQFVEAVEFLNRNPKVEKVGDINDALNQPDVFSGTVERISPGARMISEFIVREQSSPLRFRKGLATILGDLKQSKGLLAEQVPTDFSQIVADGLSVTNRDATFGAELPPEPPNAEAANVYRKIARQARSQPALDRSNVQRAFPGARVESLPGGIGWRVHMADRSVELRLVNRIPVNWQVLESDTGRTFSPEERANLTAAGMFTMTTPDGTQATGLGIISLADGLADDTTLRHESLHLARSAGLFTDREWQSLVRRYSDSAKNDFYQEEDVAEATEAWEGEPRLLEKIRAWFRKLLDAMRVKDIDAGSVRTLMQSPNFWQREATGLSPIAEMEAKYQLSRHQQAYLTEDELRATWSRQSARMVAEIWNELPGDVEFDTAVEAGFVGRDWYGRSAAALTAMFGPDTPQFANLLAATSPRQAVGRNLIMSLQIWQAWTDAGRPTAPKKVRRILEKIPGGTFPSRLPKTLEALTGRPYPYKSKRNTGQKVAAFGKNLMGDLVAVTNDVWMAYFAGIDPKRLGSRAAYTALTGRVRRAASRAGISPAQAQAAIWTFSKHISELQTEGRTTKQALSIMTYEGLHGVPGFADYILGDYRVQRELERIGLGAALERYRREQQPVLEGAIPAGTIQASHPLVLGRIGQRIPAAKGGGRGRARPRQAEKDIVTQDGMIRYQLRLQDNPANPGTSVEQRSWINEQRKRRDAVHKRETHNDAEVDQEAEDRIRRDYEGELERTKQMAAEGRLASDVEMVIAKKLLRREIDDAINTGQMDRFYAAQDILEAYDDLGTEAGRALRQRIDPMESPEQRRLREMSEEVLRGSGERNTKLKRAKQEASEASKRAATAETQGYDPEPFNRDLERAQQKVGEQKEKKQRELEELWEDVGRHGYSPQDLPTLAQSSNRARQFTQVVRTRRVSRSDKLWEYWRNAILSAPKTTGADVLSTGLYGFKLIFVDRALQAMMNAPRRVVDANLRGASMAEFGDVMAGALPGIARGISNALRAYATELPVMHEQLGMSNWRDGSGSPFDSGTARYGEAGEGSIGGRTWYTTQKGTKITTGKLIRSMGYLRLLMADEFSKAVIYHMEVNAQARRIGLERGLRGDQLKQFMAMESADPESQSTRLAMGIAMRATFQQVNPKTDEDRSDLRTGTITGGKIKESAKGLRKVPFVGKYMFPFINTPVNILETGIRESPLGLFELAWRWSELGADEKTEKIANSLIWAGVLSMLALTNDEDDPWITGAHPESSYKRRVASMRGAPAASSIKIGGRWYSYARIEPFATAVALTVDSVHAIQSSDSKRRAWAVPKAIALQLKSKTYLKGLADMVTLFDGEPDPVARWATSMVTSFLPNIIQHGARADIDQYYERRVWGDGEEYVRRLLTRGVQRTGFARGTERITYDVWGRPYPTSVSPLPKTDWAHRFLIPIENKPADVHPGDRFLMRWNALHPDDTLYPTAPDPTMILGGKSFYLTDEQYERYQRDAGKLTAQIVELLPLDAENPQPWQKDMLKKAILDSRSAVRRQILSEAVSSGQISVADFQ